MNKELKLFDRYGETPVCRTSNTKRGLPVDELDEKSWNTIRKALTPPTATHQQKLELCNSVVSQWHKDMQINKIDIPNMTLHDYSIKISSFGTYDLVCYDEETEKIWEIAIVKSMGNKITSFFMSLEEK